MSMRRRPNPEFPISGAGATVLPALLRRQVRAPIQCVYVTGTPGEAETLGGLVAPRGIRIHRAASVGEADELVGRVKCRVLLSETEFAGGIWKDVLRMIQREHPETTMVLVLPRFDGQVWVEALEQGCYDVLLKPFNPSELRNGLEDAYWYACRRPANRLHFR